jgi:hypothetical protein
MKPLVTASLMKQKCSGANNGYNPQLEAIKNDLGDGNFAAAGEDVLEEIETEVFGVISCIVHTLTDTDVGGVRDSNTKAIMAEVDACGPDCPIHEINWCNICCDQVESYCKKNNHPNGMCYKCNNFPVGTCDVPDEVDELQANLFGYCAIQKDQKPCISTDIGDIGNLVSGDRQYG